MYARFHNTSRFSLSNVEVVAARKVLIVSISASSIKSRKATCVGGKGAGAGVVVDSVAGVRSCCFFTVVRFFADDGMVVTDIRLDDGWRRVMGSKNG